MQFPTFSLRMRHGRIQTSASSGRSNRAFVVACSRWSMPRLPPARGSHYPTAPGRILKVLIVSAWDSHERLPQKLERDRSAELGIDVQVEVT